MIDEMGGELIIGPRDVHVREELAGADGWSSYATELRKLIGLVIDKVGARFLEVSELLVNEPLAGELIGLRNGAKFHFSKAIDLVERMASGLGPYCRISVPGKLVIESGWDGAIHVYMTRSMSADLAGFHCQSSILRWRDATPDVAVLKPVRDVADESFWAAVAKASERFTLLCERWAYGDCGYRWFRVIPENVVEVSLLMRPRSLVCVVSDPELQTRPELLEDGFTAFMAPLLPGELVYRAYPFGADTLSEVVDEGFTLMLAYRDMGGWCAVVPDQDGVNRALWESPAGEERVSPRPGG